MSAIIIPLPIKMPKPSEPEQPKPPAEPEGDIAVGHFLCMRCKHEWVGERDNDNQLDGFTCPSCELTTGVVRGLHYYSDEKHWTCRCGNYMFHITRERVYCPNCGRSHKPWD